MVVISSSGGVVVAFDEPQIDYLCLIRHIDSKNSLFPVIVGEGFQHTDLNIVA